MCSSEFWITLKADSHAVFSLKEFSLKQHKRVSKWAWKCKVGLRLGSTYFVDKSYPGALPGTSCMPIESYSRQVRSLWSGAIQEACSIWVAGMYTIICHLGASFFEDVPLMEYSMYLVFFFYPHARCHLTIDHSGFLLLHPLCNDVQCLSSAIFSHCWYKSLLLCPCVVRIKLVIPRVVCVTPNS